jgi:DNA-nicking Smr family endonuclease
VARQHREREDPAPDWQIDLHGKTVHEAMRQLKLGLQTCRYQRLSSLRVITGRGNTSPDRRPVLGPAVEAWLAGSEARTLGVLRHRVHSKGGAIEVELEVAGDSARRD